MSSANVLTPSAPPDPLYPQLPNFRMQKVNKISADLNGEVSKIERWQKNASVLRSCELECRRI